MKKTLPKAILIIAAILLLAACQQKTAAIMSEPGATKETLQETAVPAPETTEQETSKSLADCADEDCFYGLIPRDKATSYTFDDCKNLDGKIADDFFKTDLGMFCRLVVSRNKASFRNTDPCINRTEKPEYALNPDFEFHLESKMSINMYLVALQNQLLGKYGITEPGLSFGTSGGTLYESYHMNMESHEIAGEKRRINFDTYFCLTGDPVRYTPYFYLLEIYDKSEENTVIAGMDYIETPPVLDPVIAQYDNNIDGNEKLDKEFLSLDDFAPIKDISLISDFNGDGANDLLLVFRTFIDSYYLPILCLYDKNGNSCPLMKAKEFLSIPEVANYSSKAIIKPLAKNRFTLQILDASQNDKVVAETTYQYANDELAPVKK